MGPTQLFAFPSHPQYFFFAPPFPFSPPLYLLIYESAIAIGLPLLPLPPPADHIASVSTTVQLSSPAAAGEDELGDIREGEQEGFAPGSCDLQLPSF